MFFLCSFFVFFGISLFGCGSDPILEKAAELQKEKNPSYKEQNQAPKKGKPKEPKPVQVTPKPVVPQKPQPTEKPKINLSGRVEILGEGNWSGKPIRIDVFDGDQQILGGPRPKVISTKRLSEAGEFSLSVEKREISLWLGAYCDVDGDGRPGPNDPSGWYSKNPVSSDIDMEGIVIQLEIPTEDTAEKDNGAPK